MTKDVAYWTLDDETTFIAYLKDNQAAGSDSATFKMATFHGAAAVLEAKRTKGGPKTAKACQNKWSAVCYFISSISITHAHGMLAPSNLSCYPGHQEPVRLDLE